MPCENYKNTLTEVAAAVAEPNGELRAHLRTCGACQAALAEEQLLFAAIDSGLHVAANGEIPRSLLPRVRASLESEAAPRPFWSPKWYVLAGAGTMLAVLFVAQTLQHTRLEPKSMDSISKGAPSASSVGPAENRLPSAVAPSAGRPAIPRRPSRLEALGPTKTMASRWNSPEILVPRDQEVLLARYAEEWSRRKKAHFVVADGTNENGLIPLEVAPIQIAELDVKPLTEMESQ